MDMSSTNFKLRNVPEEMRVAVQNCSNQFKQMLRRTAIDLRDMGLHLLFLKQELGDELFTEWLESVFGCGRSTDVVNLMRAGEKFKDNNFTDLGIAGSILFYPDTQDPQPSFSSVAITKNQQNLYLLEPLQSELYRRARQMGISSKPNATRFTPVNERQTEVYSQSLVVVLKKLLGKVGIKFFNEAVAQSIHKDQAASLCNLCFGYMDEVDFSQLDVEQIKLSSFDSEALQQLLKKTQKELSGRHRSAS